MQAKFNLVDVFYTIQGEGYNSGTAALFIRMPFCNLKCLWCDTEFNKYKNYEYDEIENIIKNNKSKFAVITGGEPSINKQTPGIINLLNKYSYNIAMESNGCFKIPEGVNYLTVSPKRDSKYEIHEDAYNKASEFKYVVDDNFNFTLLDKHKSDYNKNLYLSPEFNNFQENINKIINFT